MFYQFRNLFISNPDNENMMIFFKFSTQKLLKYKMKI